MTEDIIIRKTVNDKIREAIPELRDRAIKIMEGKYPEVNFKNTNYIFSSGYSRSRYYRNEENTKYPIPTVCISTRAKLHLYDKKSLNMSRTSLFVGSEVQIMCALIHELTHHVQYERNENRGELATTRNELEYLSENHTKHYNKIMGL